MSALSLLLLLLLPVRRRTTFDTHSLTRNLTGTVLVFFPPLFDLYAFTYVRMHYNPNNRLSLLTLLLPRSSIGVNPMLFSLLYQRFVIRNVGRLLYLFIVCFHIFFFVAVSSRYFILVLLVVGLL